MSDTLANQDEIDLNNASEATNSNSTIKSAKKKNKSKKKKNKKQTITSESTDDHPEELPTIEIPDLNDTTQLLNPIPAPEVTRNLTNVLEAVKTVDARCDLAKCKKKTNLFGHNCQLCNFRYCFEHALPEIHGCGEKVRKKERDEFLHPVPLKTIRAKEEHDRAEKRLKQKLGQMSLTRKAKPT